MVSLYEEPVYRPDQPEINRRGRAYCDQVLAQQRPAAVVECVDETPLGRARLRAAQQRRERWLANLANRRGVLPPEQPQRPQVEPVAACSGCWTPTTGRDVDGKPWCERCLPLDSRRADSAA